MSNKSAGKMQEKTPPAAHKIHPKTDARHWKRRLIRRSYKRSGKEFHDPYFSIQIQHRGRRESFVLGTPNKDAAAERAREIYLSLLSNGWEATLKSRKPETYAKPTPEERPTVGRLLEAAAALCPARTVTRTAYFQAFRKIVSDIIKDSRKSASPADTAAWRERIDGVPLDSITPDRVEEWKRARLRKAGTDPVAKRRATITVNTLIRCSRSLFSRAMLPNLRKRLVLPSPLPLEGVPLEKKPSMRYQSRIDARAIIRSAREQLAGADPESFKVLLLAAICGLRVSEIDTLLWASFDFDARKLRITANQFTALKSDDSAGEIELDDEMAALFRGYHARAASEFVVESRGKPRNRSEKKSYRIEGAWKRTLQWLRANGVDDPKPIHTLRKELGSLVNQQHGLFAAKLALRHADIATTAGYYVDKKGSLSVGLGKLLEGGAKTIPFEPPPANQPVQSTTRKLSA